MSDAPTSAADPHRLRALLNAGWSLEELEWERLQADGLSAAAEQRADEAAVAWGAALELARAQFARNDPRLATSLANQAIALNRSGDAALGSSLLDEALLIWDASGDWVDALKPTQRSRSSTFHLRLESKHPGGYAHFEQERHAALAAEGRAQLAALKAGEAPQSDAATRLARWQKDRPEGYSDGRKLLAAVLLLGQ